MQLTPILPFPQLSSFIRSFWLFESDFGNPVTSSRVIAPNGCVKIILPFENELFARSSSLSQHHYEGKIQFVGIADEPYVISTHSGAQVRSSLNLPPREPAPLHHLAWMRSPIILYFSPMYTGKPDIKLKSACVIQLTRLQKPHFCSSSLLPGLSLLQSKQMIVNYAVTAINQSCGKVTIGQLEQRTGYSKRYLDILFKRFVGLSPKTLSSITRFQYFHTLWAQNPSPGFYRDEVFRFYYDQSHFIREFKRFSGYTPEQYAVTDNEFGRIFYKD